MSEMLQVERSPELRFTLKPQESVGNHGQVYTQIDMYVKCQQKYPDV